MAPPVRHNHVWRGALAVAPGIRQPRRLCLVGHDRALGQQRTERGGDRVDRQRTGRPSGRAADPAIRAAASARAEGIGQRLERGRGIVVVRRRGRTPRSHRERGSSPCPGTRRTRPVPWRRRGRGGGTVRAASHANSARYARRVGSGKPAPRSMRVGNVSASSCAPLAVSDPAVPRSAPVRRARPAEEQRDRLAGAHHLRNDDRPASRSTAVRPGPRAGACRHTTVGPGDVGGKDQRGDLTGRPERGGDGLGGVGTEIRCRRSDAGPTVDTLRATVSMSDSSCASYRL